MAGRPLRRERIARENSAKKNPMSTFTAFEDLQSAHQLIQDAQAKGLPEGAIRPVFEAESALRKALYTERYWYD